MPRIEVSQSLNGMEQPFSRKQLQQWFSHVESAQSDMDMNVQNLAHFGLKHAEQLLSFLQSPAGRIIKELMLEDLENIALIQKAELDHQQKIRLRHHLMLLAFLFAELEEKNAEAKQLNQEIQNQINQQLHREADALESEHHANDEATIDEIEAYHDLTKSLEQGLESKRSETSHIELDLADLETQIKEIERIYQHYDHILDHDTPPLPEQLQDEITKTESQLSSYATIISSMLSAGNDSEAKERIELKHALHFKSEMLKMMKTAHLEKRNLMDRSGRPALSFADADFYIPNDKVLTLEEGQYYLHSHSKEFKQLTPKEKQDAKVDYQEARNEIMSMRMQLQLKQSQELSIHHAKRNELTMRRETLAQETRALQKGLTQIKDIQSTLQASLSQANSRNPRPLPMSTPASRELDRRNIQDRFRNGGTLSPVEQQQLLKMALKNPSPTLPRPKTPMPTDNAATPTPFSRVPRPKPYM